MPIPFILIGSCVFLFLSGCSYKVLNTQNKNTKKQVIAFSKSAESPLVGSVHTDLCEIFTQKPTWYKSALKSQKKMAYSNSCYDDHCQTRICL